MLFGANGNGDPREFMNFNGKTYINGTHFTVKDKYIATHKPDGKKIWKHASFWGTVNGNDGIYYYFSRAKYSYCDLLEVERETGEDIHSLRTNYAPFFIVRPWELDDVIEEFIHPIILSETEQDIVNRSYEDMVSNPKTDFDYPEMIVAWIIYMGALIGSLIFTHFYLLWPIITYIFFKYRKEVMG